LVIDLFAGPGGWDLAAVELGLDPLGIEWDAAACETRDAAGFRTVQADISELDPDDFAPCEGLIASPPCQAWSLAGSGGGQRDKARVYQCLADLEQGRDTRAELLEGCEDKRSLLVAEPLRWILALEPKWVALEQVPPVLELWQEYKTILLGRGYRAWAGVLSAERYGVPQTRKRATLLAHRDRYPSPPQPTHQAYVPGEPAQHEATLEGELLPWVSMAEALGWGAIERPIGTISSRSLGVGGSGARNALKERGRGLGYPSLRLARGKGISERHGERPDYEPEKPAPTVTSKLRTATSVRGGVSK
jgi:DNA (cytosine-5)-methyltransferase 1